MKNWLNKYFGFTKREYNGLITLMVILLLISVLPYFYTNYVAQAEPLSPEEKIGISKLMLVSTERPSNYTKMYEEGDARETAIHTTLFKFDPNKIEVQQWQELGLSLKQAQAIVNYRNKGGKFFKASDLQRMYTITPEKYKQLEPYIEIEKSNSVENPTKHVFAEKYPKRELIIVELNGADTLLLDQIKGVGAAFARRIAKYRDKLGGFYKKEQLMEVFGVDSAKYQEIKDQVSVDVTKLHKININTAEFEGLKNHPYLTYKQINVLIQYRKQHGRFNGIEDLKKVAILTPQNIQNLAPYLIF